MTVASQAPTLMICSQQTVRCIPDTPYIHFAQKAQKATFDCVETTDRLTQVG